MDIEHEVGPAYLEKSRAVSIRAGVAPKWDIAKLRDDTTRRWEDIQRFGVPDVVILGSSHIGRWEDHRRSQAITNAENLLLNHVYMMYSGGAKTTNIINRFSGHRMKGVTDRDVELGNRWEQYRETCMEQDRNDKYCILEIGSNDVDSKRYELERMEMQGKREKEIQDKTREIAEVICGNISDVVSHIKLFVPYSQMLFVSILPRRKWGQAAINLGMEIDVLVDIRLKIPVVKVRDDFRINRKTSIEEYKPDKPTPTMYKINEDLYMEDGIHFNMFGYRALVRALMISVWDRHIIRSMDDLKKKSQTEYASLVSGKAEARKERRKAKKEMKRLQRTARH